jgi:hypothetical protein
MMKHYYSIVAYSTISVQYQEPSLVFIEPGINAFTVLTDDIENFLAHLKSEGIRVDKVNQLDGEEAFEGSALPPTKIGLPELKS